MGWTLKRGWRHCGTDAHASLSRELADGEPAQSTAGPLLFYVADDGYAIIDHVAAVERLKRSNEASQGEGTAAGLEPVCARLRTRR